MKIKNIRKAARGTKAFVAWALFYNPRTGEAVVEELVSASEEPRPAEGFHYVSMGLQSLSMKEIEAKINEASYQW